MKNLFVHSSQTLQPSSIRLMLTLVSLKDFDVWMSQVTQKYLQSKCGLQKPILIKKVIPVFQLDCSLALQLICPLYDLSESRDLFLQTSDEHYGKDLGMKSLHSYLALHLFKKQGRSIGMFGTYIDGILRIGPQQFCESVKATNARFKMCDNKNVR